MKYQLGQVITQQPSLEYAAPSQNETCLTKYNVKLWGKVEKTLLNQRKGYREAIEIASPMRLCHLHVKDTEHATVSEVVLTDMVIHGQITSNNWLYGCAQVSATTHKRKQFKKKKEKEKPSHCQAETCKPTRGILIGRHSYARGQGDTG